MKALMLVGLAFTILVNVINADPPVPCSNATVSAILTEPYVMAVESTNNSIEYQGFLVNILTEAFKNTSCSFKITHRNDSIYGKKDAGGQWTGIIGDIVNGERDIGAALITVTQMRETAVDFTNPFLNYGAKLILKARRHDQKPVIKTFQDFLDQEDIKIGIVAGSPIERFLNQTSDPSYRQIYQQMQNDAENLVLSSNHEGVTKARNDNYFAFLMDGGIAESIVRKEPCDLMALDTDIYKRQYAFAVQNQSPLRDFLNHAMIDLQYSNNTLQDLYDHWLPDNCSKATSLQVCNAFISLIAIHIFLLFT